MDDLNVIPVGTKHELEAFLKLPWKIYKGNKYWVPPLIKDVADSINSEKTHALKKIEHESFIAFSNGKPVGRIFAGIDNLLNTRKNVKLGHFSLFECINDYNTAKTLLDTAVNWMKKRNIDTIRGPVSTTGTDGDEYKGLLIDCFDKPPVFMNTYNPPYYKEFLEKYGFVKDYDLFAYHLDTKKLFNKKNISKIIAYAGKKYGFRVDNLNMKNIQNEIRDIHYILKLAVPDEWPDMVAPSLDDVKAMTYRMISVIDPEIIQIARSGDEPVGFGIALPDYNQVLKHLNGKLTPLSMLKYYYYKKRINYVRFFVMFVIPAYRKKGVSYAIYYRTFLNGKNKGYFYGEGSTIGETNLRMRNDIESFGGEKYKTYRVYKKEV